MSTPLALSMQISANTSSLAGSVRDVNARLDSMGAAAKKAAGDLSILKTIEISRAFLSAVTSAASSFQSLVVGSASAVASIDDLSKRTGVSSTALQGYQFAADQSGVSIETFGKALQKLTINLGEAQTGNKSAVKAFADLGLSVQELQGLSPQVAFEKIAAAIALLPNPAQQAAAAVSLFGKSGIDLVPVFQEGATFLEEMRLEAERLGTVLSEDQVGNLANLDDSIAKVSSAFSGLTSRVVADLAPALKVAADQLATFFSSLDADQVVGVLEESLKALTGVAEALGIAFKLVYVTLQPLAAVVFPALAATTGFLVQNIKGAALGALLAASAYAAYSIAALSATGATVAFTAALRLFLASTGVGLLVVALGALGGAVLQWMASTDVATSEIQRDLDATTAATARVRAELEGAGAAAGDLGKDLTNAFKLPAEVTNVSLTQGLVEEAGQAFRALAADVGTLEAVPQELLDAMEFLKKDIALANDGIGNQIFKQQMLARSASDVLRITQEISAARQEEKKRIDDVVDGVRQAQEYERQLKDEQQKRIDDITGRELEAQADIASALADNERQRLQGLSFRNNEPLKAADIRTSEGIGQFLALATNREDPAVAESRKQTVELEAMNRKLDELAAQKADILGGA